MSWFSDLRNKVQQTSKDLGVTDKLNQASAAWKEFWDKPMTIQYAHNPYEVVANKGPQEITQRRGDVAKQVALASSVPALAAGVAAVGVPATISGLTIGTATGAAGSYGGKKAAQFIGLDKNAQELAGNIAGTITGFYGLTKGVQFPKNYKIYKINRALNQGIDENAIITGYQRNPRMMDTGTLQQYQQYLDQVFPETKVSAIQWHGGKKGIQQLINPGIGSHVDNYTSNLGIYVTPKKAAAMGYRKNVISLGQKDIPFIDQLKANFGFGKVKQQTIDKYTDIYPVKINANNVVSTYKSGTLTPEIVNSSGVNTVFKGGTSIFPEYVYTNPDQGLILGSNQDLIGFQNFIKSNHCGGKLNYLNYIK